MKDDSQICHRRSIRLKGYDYTQPGAYFVMICTYQRQEIFGEVVAGNMQLSPSGKIVREEWLKTTQIRQEVKLHEDEFVIMPNHIHGIIWIVETLTGEATLKSIESVAVVGATRRVAPTRQGQRRLEELNYFKKG